MGGAGQESKKADIEPYLDIKLGPNKRYCNRHRPDVICNRQADARKASEIQQAMDSLENQKDREVINSVWSLFSTAGSKQRSIILQGLLAQCCSPQLSVVSAMLEDLLRVDFIESLPPELSVKILCYLDTESLCRAAQVCRKWKQLADDDVVWHRMCEQHIDKKCTKCGWGLPLLEKKRLRDSKKDIQARVENMKEQSLKDQKKKRKLSEMECEDVEPASREPSTEPQDEPPQKKTRPWKDVYAERFRVERNWRENKYMLKVFRNPGNRNDTILSLQFDDQYLITGSFDGTVRVWDVETETVLRELNGHTAAVNALKFDSQKLVTASSDKTVRIWNYRTGDCISTFQGHEDNALCVDTQGTVIASGSQDGSIRVLDFETKSCYTLRGHNDAVYDVKIDPRLKVLHSASEDGTVKMWCLPAKKCIKTFGGGQGNGGNQHVAPVTSVVPLRLDHLEGNDDYHHQQHESESEADGDNVSSSSSPPDSELNPPTHLLSSSLDNTIKLWDVNTGQCVRTLFGHVEGVWSISADTFRIISGAHDKMVKVWDLQSGKCRHTFTGHTASVNCVGLNDTRFASGGDDGSVRMYCFDDIS